MRLLASFVLWSLSFPIYVHAATPEEMQAFRAYQTEKALAHSVQGHFPKAVAYARLAGTDHAKRLPYVAAWCHENAAYHFWQAGAFAQAETEAEEARSDGATTECADKAAGILKAIAEARAKTTKK